MLHNLTTKELGEVTFHFLNNPTRFNHEEKDHYSLLWKISDLTYREGVSRELRKVFREKFGGNIANHQVW